MKEFEQHIIGTLDVYRQHSVDAEQLRRIGVRVQASHAQAMGGKAARVGGTTGKAAIATFVVCGIVLGVALSATTPPAERPKATGVVPALVESEVVEREVVEREVVESEVVEREVVEREIELPSTSRVEIRSPASELGRSSAAAPRQRRRRPAQAVAKPRDPAPVPQADPAAPASDFLAELALIKAARAALREGKPRAALESLGAHGRRFGRRGSFAAENLLLQAMANCALGSNKRAREFIAMLYASHPNHAILSRAARVCPAVPETKASAARGRER